MTVASLAPSNSATCPTGPNTMRGYRVVRRARLRTLSFVADRPARSQRLVDRLVPPQLYSEEGPKSGGPLSVASRGGVSWDVWIWRDEYDSVDAILVPVAHAGRRLWG